MIYYIYMIMIIIMIITSTRKISNGNEKYSIEQNLPIRGVLSILVIMCHIFPQAYLLGNIAVSIFFCFSGYGLMWGYMNKKSPFKNYFKNKIINTILPFWIINIIYYIYYCFNDKSYTFGEFVLSFFNASILTIGWYIIVLSILYIVFYCIFKKSDIKNKVKVLAVCVATIFLIFILYIVGCKSWWYCSLLAFPIGILLKYNDRKITILCTNKHKWLTIIIIVSFLLVYGVTKYYNIEDGLLFLLIKVYMSIVACYFYIRYSDKYIIKNKILNFIGKYSLIIYLIHPLIIKIINKCAVINILKFPIVLIISIIISYIYNQTAKYIKNINNSGGIKL